MSHNTARRLGRIRKRNHGSTRGLSGWFWVTAAVLVALITWAQASDLNKGYTFLPTDHVTSTKLNNLVDLASINATFISGQTATLVPQAADAFILYSATATALRKCTLGALSASVLTNSDATMRSNFWADFWTSGPADTNLFSATTTGDAGTNYAPAWNPSTNGWTRWALPQSYTSPAFNFTYGFKTNLAHGLSNTPVQVSWVLSCASAEAQNGFNVGDEIAVGSVAIVRTNGVGGALPFTQPAFNSGANSSNVFIHCATNDDAFMPNAYITVGTNNVGNGVRLTNSNWRLKAYARFYP